MRGVTLSLGLPGGAQGTIVGLYRDKQTRTSEWLELAGDAGSITVDDMTRRVIVSGIDPDRREILEPSPLDAETFYDSLIRHVRAFVAAIAQGSAIPVPGGDGLAGLELAVRAIESLPPELSAHVSHLL